MTSRTQALAIGTATAVAAALVVLAGPAASQGPDADRRTALRTSAEQLQRLRPVEPRRDVVASGTGCVRDAAGDPLPGPHAPADIDELCVAHGDALRVTLRAAQPADPATDPAWADGVTGALLVLDVNGDDTADLELFHDTRGATVREPAGRPAPGCPALTAWDGTALHIEVAGTCLAGVDRVAVVAFLGHDADTDGVPAGDFAPDAGALVVTRPAPPPPGAPGPHGTPPPGADPATGAPGGGAAPMPAPSAVPVVLPEPASGPSAAVRATGRLAGSDRIATAVAVSRHAFPDGAREVYLARADDTADALAGAGLEAGPVLLVPSCGPLPDAVRAEVARLDPDRVLALGGPTAVCDALLDEAAGP